MVTILAETSGIDVLVLCGGAGERLRSAVNDRPKPMAQVAERPFLDILTGYIANFGFRRFILCVGYMGHFIKDYYKTAGDNIEFLFSEEKSPLGTAGAVKNALPLIASSPFLVINGDSFCPVDLRKFVDFHESKRSELSIVLSKSGERNECGVVGLDRSDRVISFGERRNREGSFLNAGIYLFTSGILSLIPSGIPYSLEHDLFPNIKGRRCYGYVAGEKFIDIGTPGRYKKAQAILREINLGHKNEQKN